MNLKLTIDAPQGGLRRFTIFVGVPIALVLGATMVASAYDTTWIAPNQPLSASALKTDLDEVQQRLSTLEAGIANNVTVVQATVRGATGGAVVTPCPSGYHLAGIALVGVQLTDGGVSGWPMGTYGCANVTGQLQASLSNYATGSTQTAITCEGTCVK